MTEQIPANKSEGAPPDGLTFTFTVPADLVGIDADGMLLLLHLIMAMLGNGASIYELQQRLMGFQ